MRYSFMEHLARSVLFSRYADDALMVMFTSYSAYFDASGHPDGDNKVMTVGGFVSTVKKWGRFDEEWSAILKSEGVAAFHTTDFASSGGEFKKWRGQTDRRRKFVTRLTACIKKNVNKSFRSSIVLQDYDEVNALFKLEEVMGRPYSMCASNCLTGVHLWARSKKVSEKHVLCFFEDGDKDKGDFQRMAKKGGKFITLRPEFLTKDRVIAFQAADFAAWKLRTAFQESLKIGHTHAKGQRLLESIAPLMGIPHDGSGIHKKEQLLKFCAIQGVEKR